MPTKAEMRPFRAAGLHIDEWPLCREHDAEHHQHHGAADINQKLHRPRPGRRPSKKKMPEVPASVNKQPSRRAHDVLRHHRGDGAQAP